VKYRKSISGNLTVNGTISIKKTVDEISSDLLVSLPKAKRRLNRFVIAFNKRFRVSSPFERGTAEAITWALMGAPLALFALGFNGSVVVELYSILERFSIRETIRHTTIPAKRPLVTRIFEHSTLQDFAPLLVELGYFEKKDLKFVEKLSKLRNGVAHKNPRIISNVVVDGREIPFLDIDTIMNKFDSLPLILETISLLSKMAKAKP
jgi:hypothetical protein